MTRSKSRFTIPATWQPPPRGRTRPAGTVVALQPLPSGGWEVVVHLDRPHTAEGTRRVGFTKAAFARLVERRGGSDRVLTQRVYVDKGALAFADEEATR